MDQTGKTIKRTSKSRGAGSARQVQRSHTAEPDPGDSFYKPVFQAAELSDLRRLSAIRRIQEKLDQSQAAPDTPGALAPTALILREEFDLLRVAMRRLMELAGEAKTAAEWVRIVQALGGAAGHITQLVKLQMEYGRPQEDDLARLLSQAIDETLAEYAAEEPRPAPEGDQLGETPGV